MLHIFCLLPGSLQVSHTCWKLALIDQDHLCIAVVAVVVLLVTDDE